jgi:hypothetical protein
VLWPSEDSAAGLAKARHIHKIDFEKLSHRSFKASQLSVQIEEVSILLHLNKRTQVCCNCQKSRCLKLYCDCFRTKQYCRDCKCSRCLNTHEFEELRAQTITQTLKRNPQAFKKPKYEEGGRVCNCKKSGCRKKYCECYQGGMECNALCKCKGCKNLSRP